MMAFLLVTAISSYGDTNWEGPFTIKSIDVQATSTPAILFNIKEQATTYCVQVAQLGVDAEEIKMLLSALLSAQSTKAKITIHCEQSGVKYVDIISILSP